MHHVCGATDLYSLACIAYKLLAGCAPFSGDPKELLKAHAYELPPELKPAVRVPDGVVAFITRCLNKKPWDRYEFAAEARRVWAQFKPPDPVDARLWRFPRITRRTRESSTSMAEVTTPRLHTQPDGDRGDWVAPEGGRGLLSIRPTPMVGRHPVRERLLAACNEVITSRDTSHRLVMLVGPAGVGKSRVAEWLTATVHEEGRMATRTRSRSTEGQSPSRINALRGKVRETAVEMKKINWPDRETTRNLTIFVIGISVVLGLVLGGVDAIFVKLWELLSSL